MCKAYFSLFKKNSLKFLNHLSKNEILISPVTQSNAIFLKNFHCSLKLCVKRRKENRLNSYSIHIASGDLLKVFLEIPSDFGESNLLFPHFNSRQKMS